MVYLATWKTAGLGFDFARPGLELVGGLGKAEGSAGLLLTLKATEASLEGPDGAIKVQSMREWPQPREESMAIARA